MIKQTPLQDLTSHYRRWLLLSGAVFIGLFSVFILRQVSIEKNKILTELTTQVDHNTAELSRIIDGSYSHILTMNDWIVRKIQDEEGTGNSKILKLLKVSPDTSSETRFDFPHRPDGFGAKEIGNIIGSGDPHTASTSMKKDLAIFPGLLSLHATILNRTPDITWVYYYSKDGLLAFSPYVPAVEMIEGGGNDSYVSLKKIFEEAEFVTMSYPKVNPSRFPYWTNAYLGHVGEGLITTIGSPVYISDEYHGFVAIDLSLKFLTKIINDFPRKDGVFFVANIGSLAHAKDQRTLIELEGNQALASSKHILFEGDSVKSLSDFLSEDVSLEDIGKILDRGPSKIGSQYFIARKLPPSPWVTLLIVSESELLTRIAPAMFPYLLGLLGFIISLLIMYRSHQQQLVSPAFKLVTFIDEASNHKSLTTPPQINKNVPKMWRPWFDQVESAIQENLQLVQELSDHAGDLDVKITEAVRELKAKNQFLLDSEHRFQVLVDASFEGIIIHHKGEIVASNSQFASLHGYTLPEDLIGQKINSFIAPGSQEDVSKNLAAGFDKPYEATNVRKDGTLFTVEVCGKTIPYNKKECRVVAIKDITERKEHEKEKERLIAELHEAKFLAKDETMKLKAMSQDKLASLGLLATGVTHEINQPLTYIKIIFQSCLRDMKEGALDLAELQEDCLESLRQLNRITTIIDHLRMFGREDCREKEHVNIEEVLNNSLILIGNKLRLRNIEFISNIAAKSPVVYGSMIQLEQVFINLLQNSIDALAEVKEKNIYVSVLSENSRIVIKFSDSGKGIPSDVSDKIFEPFFTTKEVGKGTGLGLSIVFGIVQEHDGTIEYFPEKQGCTFIISFPETV